MLQSVRYKIIIYSLISVILMVLLGFWVYWAKAQARDYQRLADIKVWQDVLSEYYAQNGTYAVANCVAGDLLSRCLNKVVGKQVINNINDPVNISPYQYVVAGLSETDFEIRFSLEAGIGGLPAGQYIWTKEGVKR